MKKYWFYIGFLAILISSCVPDQHYSSTALLGSWEGQLVQTQELSYAFDTRGYLPFKVVDLPEQSLVKFHFEADLVTISVDQENQIFHYSVERNSSNPELILASEGKILKLEIIKFRQDTLELRFPPDSDTKVLNRSYVLIRK